MRDAGTLLSPRGPGRCAIVALCDPKDREFLLASASEALELGARAGFPVDPVGHARTLGERERMAGRVEAVLPRHARRPPFHRPAELGSGKAQPVNSSSTWIQDEPSAPARILPLAWRRDLSERWREGSPNRDVFSIWLWLGNPVHRGRSPMAGGRTAWPSTTISEATACSGENFARNQIRGVAIGDRHLDQAEGSFDVILANIQADVLCALAAAMASKVRARPRDSFGHFLEQADEVLAVFAQVRFRARCDKMKANGRAACSTRQFPKVATAGIDGAPIRSSGQTARRTSHLVTPTPPPLGQGTPPSARGHITASSTAGARKSRRASKAWARRRSTLSSAPAANSRPGLRHHVAPVAATGRSDGHYRSEDHRTGGGPHRTGLLRAGMTRPASEGRDRRRRWRTIAEEAARQCGSRRCSRSGETWSRWPTLCRENIRAQPTAGSSCGKKSAPSPFAKRLASGPRQVAILVGPEGGFPAVKSHAVRAAGFQAVGLGRRVLRSETASIVAVALAQAAAGGLD